MIQLHLTQIDALESAIATIEARHRRRDWTLSRRREPGCAMMSANLRHVFHGLAERSEPHRWTVVPGPFLYGFRGTRQELVHPSTDIRGGAPRPRLNTAPTPHRSRLRGIRPNDRVFVVGQGRRERRRSSRTTPECGLFATIHPTNPARPFSSLEAAFACRALDRQSAVLGLSMPSSRQRRRRAETPSLQPRSAPADDPCGGRNILARHRSESGGHVKTGTACRACRLLFHSGYVWRERVVFRPTRCERPPSGWCALTATNVSGSTTTTATLTVNPPGGTITTPVNASGDDVNEVNGSLTTNASTVWLGNGGSAATSLERLHGSARQRLNATHADLKHRGARRLILSLELAVLGEPAPERALTYAATRRSPSHRPFRE